MAAELQVRAPDARPWILAWLAATLAAEALTALLALLPGLAPFRLVALVVAVVAPLAILIGVVACRRRARRAPMTRTGVMSVFLAIGAGGLAATPVLISLVLGVASLIQSTPEDLSRVIGGAIAFAVIAEIVGLVLGVIPAVVLAYLSGWIVTRVAFEPARDG